MLPANRMAKLGISEQVHAYGTQTYSQSKLVGFAFTFLMKKLLFSVHSVRAQCKP